MIAETETRGHTGRSLRARFGGLVAAEFAAQPLQPGGEPLVAADIAGLPDPVRG